MSLLKFCDACKQGKLHQHPHISQPTKTTKAFQLIHSDLWGPSYMCSAQGFKYYISFVDDFTRYTWIYPMSTKSETTSLVKYFLKMIHCQFQTSVQGFQCEWGGEFRPLESLFKTL